jgi:hypothetical protein
VASSSFTPKDAKEKVYRTDIVAETIRKLPKNGGAASGGFIDDTQGDTAEEGAVAA